MNVICSEEGVSGTRDCSQYMASAEAELHGYGIVSAVYHATTRGITHILPHKLSQPVTGEFQSPTIPRTQVQQAESVSVLSGYGDPPPPSGNATVHTEQGSKPSKPSADGTEGAMHTPNAHDTDATRSAGRGEGSPPLRTSVLNQLEPQPGGKTR